MAEISPELKAWLDKYNLLMSAWSKKGFVLSPEIARDGMTTLTRTMVTDIPALPLVVDEEVGGPDLPVPVRVYHPEPELDLPVLIYLHGGGHMAGSVAVYDPICRKIALATRRIVIAVDYRLAPEHPYPAGIADARTVVCGYRELLLRLRLNSGAGLALVGDSAGGAMSATLAHMLTDQGEQVIDHLVLIYPSLDYTLSQPSVDVLAAGYLLEKKRILWYFDHYFCAGEDRQGASPLFLPVSRGYPRTLIFTAEFCPLRDEGLAYAAKLEKSGVPVQHHQFGGLLHAFLNLENLVPTGCRKLYERMSEFLGSGRNGD